MRQRPLREESLEPGLAVPARDGGGGSLSGTGASRGGAARRARAAERWGSVRSRRRGGRRAGRRSPPWRRRWRARWRRLRPPALPAARSGRRRRGGARSPRARGLDWVAGCRLDDRLAERPQRRHLVRGVGGDGDPDRSPDQRERTSSRRIARAERKAGTDGIGRSCPGLRFAIGLAEGAVSRTFRTSELQSPTPKASAAAASCS